MCIKIVEIDAFFFQLMKHTFCGFYAGVTSHEKRVMFLVS